jgi:hypothetical protein
MAPQILRAYVAGDYTKLFQEILSQVQPDEAVLSDANTAGGTFICDIEERIAELDGNVRSIPFHEHWKRRQMVSNDSCDYTGRAINSDFDGLYEGYECNAQGVEVFGSLPGNWTERFVLDALVKVDCDEWPRR